MQEPLIQRSRPASSKGSNFRQLRVLLWKNWILKRRHPLATLVELLLPPCFMLILAIIRPQVTVVNFPDTLYTSEAVALTTYDSTYSTGTYGILTNIFYYCKYQNAKFAVAPANNPWVQEYVKSIERETAYLIKNGSLITQFNTAEEMDAYVEDEDYCKQEKKPCLAGGIVFNKLGEDLQWDYSLRFNISILEYKSVPRVDRSTVDVQKGLNKNWFYKYQQTGFLSMQAYTDAYILNNHANSTAYTSFTFLPFPERAYSKDPFQGVIARVLPLFMVLTFLLSVSRLISGIVLEKELKIREGMRMMGLGNFALYGSWYVTYGLIFGIIAFFLALSSTVGGVFKYSSGVLLFCWFWAFGLSIISFSFLITVFFSRAKTASTVGVLAFFGSFFVYFTVGDDTYSYTTKFFSSLLPTTAFGLGASSLGTLEGGQIGVRFDSMFTSIDNYNFATSLIMLILDIFIYALIGWYLDQVIPSEFGTAQPPWFLCTRRYWCHSRNSHRRSFLGGNEEDGEENDSSPLEPGCVEDVTMSLKQMENEDKCVQIKGLRKVFGDKVAVDRLDLTMYEGQIFALLGHNGAGKTTTISMLTGLTGPSAGNAFVFGQSIRTDMGDLRSSMGVCPQHDILFPELTVKEHLELFAVFKGLPAAEVEAAVRQKISEVGLTEKVDTLSKNLSGGMKRKLSVAIALIGDSKLVVLDEPTSGMDPFSRRSTWNVLKNNKAGRVIILTTHFMDEADILGDRIAIMGEGRLRCCGSSMFLKNRYGVGYCLTLVKDSDRVSNDAEVKQLIFKYVPDAKVLTDIGAEISFQLPFSTSNAFGPMLSELEAKKAQLGIGSYGISATKLEEVFLRIARGENETERLKQARASLVHEAHPHGTGLSSGLHMSLNMAGQDEEIEEGQLVRAAAQQSTFTIMIRHIMAMMKKRFLYSLRDWKSMIYELVVPIFMLFIGLILLRSIHFAPRPDYILTTSDYNTQEHLTNIIPFNYLQGVSEVTSHVPASVGSVVSVNISSSATTKEKKMDEFGRYLLRSIQNYQSSRYGALMFFDSQSAGIAYNSSGIHAPPIYLNILNNAVLRSSVGDSANLIVRHHGFPVTQAEKNSLNTANSFSASLIIMIAFSFIPAGLVAFIVRERETAVKHQQLVSGVNVNAYWFANWLVDVIKYMVPFSLAILLVYLFGIDGLVQGDSFEATVLLFLCFGPSVISFTYVCSFLFEKYSTAQNVVLMINFLTGLILMIVAFILRLIPSTTDLLTDFLIHIFRLFPPFSFSDGLLSLSLRQLFMGKKPLDWDFCGANIAALCYTTVGYLLIVLLIEFINNSNFFGPLLSKLGPSLPASALTSAAYEGEDDDVGRERVRVDRLAPQDAVVRVANLKKIYPGSPPKFAVKQLSFGIPNGECFALLGINGAGKTSAFRMLTGEYSPSAGDASIGGYDVVHQLAKARQLIGYCPQFDALLDLLSPKEHLELYAKIKGIPSDKVAAVVARKLEEMDLLPYINKPAGTLSGGNKRKLSVAIAMIGSPPIVFLDEPSTGMDPVSRRFMWDVIARISTERKESSVILTTHSMEEAEALCSRIAIMVGGKVKCLGSAQHLKHKFGQGYELEIKTVSPSAAAVDALMPSIRSFVSQDGLIQADSIRQVCSVLNNPERFTLISAEGSGSQIFQQMKEGQVSALGFAEWWLTEDAGTAVHSFITTNFPGSLLLEHHGSFWRFRLVQAGFSLAALFNQLSAYQQSLNIQEYSLSQTTLEQIFNSLASQQEEEQGQVAGMFFARN